MGAVDPEVWRDLLDRPRKQLARALGDVTREAAEAKATQTAKDGALAAFRETLVATVWTVQGLARLGGRGALVESLRASVSSTGSGGESPPSPSPSPAPTPPTG